MNIKLHLRKSQKIINIEMFNKYHVYYYLIIYSIKYHYITT